ncbi:Microtubule-associated tumor suppressor 1, partial [Acanthisitta chloris]
MGPSALTLKRGCENKTTSTIKTPSHKEAPLLPSSGPSPGEKHASVKNSPASWTSSGKSLAKSKVPVKRSVLERTPSLSSVSSTQSEQSNSASATVIKYGGWPSKPACQNDTSGSVSLKALPRPRSHSLKSTPKGAKTRSASLNHCIPKSLGPLHS